MNYTALTADDRFVVDWEFTKDGLWVPVWGTPEYIRALTSGAYSFHGGQGDGTSAAAQVARNGAAPVAPVGAENTAVAVVAVGDYAQGEAALHVPHLSGMSLTEAALAYAEAGWYVLPLRPGTKRPALDNWDENSSRDPEQLRQWWTGNPNYGIGLHLGRSGAVGFDFDGDDLDVIVGDGRSDMAEALRSAGVILGTRPAGDRCHYLFATEPADNFGNSAGAFMPYGQVRGRNGYIAVAPTPHPDAETKGGEYNQRRTGLVGPLPEVLRRCLSAASKDADPLSPEELDEFMGKYDGEDSPKALKGHLTNFANRLAGGAGRHDSMCAVVPWAFRESIARRFPAQRAYEELRAAFDEVKPDKSDPQEFERMALWAAAQAELADLNETMARFNRNVWPHPSSPLLVARKIADTVAAESQPIMRWRGQWRQWSGTYWPLRDDEAMRNALYRMLADAFYEKQQSVVPWNPDVAKLNKALDALKSVVRMNEEIQPPTWLNGTKDSVIACCNGLLRVNDRALLPHTAEYFNDFALPYDYDPKAKSPERWLKFLAEVFPGDTAAQDALQDWFGYVVSGRTDLQKMLLLIGRTRSGKGTIGRTLSALVGDRNYVGLQANDLQGGFGKQALLGKTLASFSDLRMTGRAKQFVELLLTISGEDPVTIQIKYAPDWHGRLSARFVLMGNELPTLPDNSGAIVGRFLALHTKESFLGREDYALEKTLREELPGILAWSLDGLDRLIARGSFEQPESGEKLLGLLRQSASPIMQFVDEKCVIDAKAEVPKQSLFEEWKWWCSDNGNEHGNSASFGKKLLTAFDELGEARRGEKGAQVRHYTGIGLREPKRVPGSWAVVGR